MRLLIAGLAALAAVSFATPSFAQDDPSATPAPVPATKTKPSTASCQSLKSASARNSCLKKAQASTTKAAPTTKKAKKTTTTPAATPAAAKPETSQTPPPPASASVPPSTSGTVAVPPLPQKTI